MTGIPPYGAADEAAARRAIDMAIDLTANGAGQSSAMLLREVAGAVAQARREGGEAALAPFHALFSGEPDTPCRTTYRWPPEVECVELPVADLQATFEEAERAIE